MLKVKDIIKRQIHPYIPNFSVAEFFPRKNDYAIIIPTLNEGLRLQRQLEKMKGMNLKGDIVISDAPSHDNSTNPDTLKKLGVNALIKLTEEGGVSSSLRAAFCYCLNKNYQGIITIDGNDKDDTKTVKKFIHQLKQGYDFIQGSRFLKGGHEMNTPKSRLLLIKWLHAPIMNLVSGFRFTDTTNGFRAYSRKFLISEKVRAYRQNFIYYDIYFFLAWSVAYLGFKVKEIPVTRKYPSRGRIPTKINSFRGYWRMLKPLLLISIGYFKDR